MKPLGNKKYALTLGIKANKRVFTFTDADCYQLQKI
jgi:hypothetical protein